MTSRPLRGMFAAMLFCAASALAASPSQRIDLVTVGVNDLDAGMAMLEALGGVRPAYGGRHPTRGTHNALLSLGDGSYLEIVAPQPGADPATSAELAMLTALTRPTVLWWGVGAADAAGLTASLRMEGFPTEAPVAGSRTTPAGDVLSWSTFVLRDPPGGAPFFIAWSPDSRHPSTTSPGGCALAALEVASPDRPSLDRLLRLLGVEARTSPGAAPRLTLRVACPLGEVVFESA